MNQLKLRHFSLLGVHFNNQFQMFHEDRKICNYIYRKEQCFPSTGPLEFLVAKCAEK
jgi:hypothetical protein